MNIFVLDTNRCAVDTLNISLVKYHHNFFLLCLKWRCVLWSDKRTKYLPHPTDLLNKELTYLISVIYSHYKLWKMSIKIKIISIRMKNELVKRTMYFLPTNLSNWSAYKQNISLCKRAKIMAERLRCWKTVSIFSM